MIICIHKQQVAIIIIAMYLKCQYSHTTCIYFIAHYFLVTKQHNQIMNIVASYCEVFSQELFKMDTFKQKSIDDGAV